MTHPTWCLVDRCDAAQPGGVHRSAPFRLLTAAGAVNARYWAVPASADNPEPSAYMTLLGAAAQTAVSTTLEQPADHRRITRRGRRRLAASLTTIPETEGTAAA